MLSKRAVLEHVRRDDISLSYCYDPRESPAPTPLQENDRDVHPDNPNEALKIFDSYFFGDRLAITLGPIVLSHSKNRRRGRKLYKGHAGCFDLRESDGKISLLPGETLTFHSIEQISTGPQVAAIILPRLSIATGGVIVAPSYIDPYWDGILQLHLTNESQTSFELHFGERLAICRFYDVTGEAAPESERRRFAQKSHHYGLNWERILSSDEFPYPLRKHPSREDSFSIKAKRQGRRLLAIWPQLFGISLVAAVAIGLIGYGGLQAKIDQVVQVGSSINDAHRTIDRMNSKVAALAASKPVAGTVPIRLAQNETSKSVTVELPQEFRPVGVVIATTTEPDSTAVQGVIRSDPGGSGPTLELSVRRTDTQASPLGLEVAYIVG